MDNLITCEFCGESVKQGFLERHQKMSKACLSAQGKTENNSANITSKSADIKTSGDDSWEPDRFNRTTWNAQNILHVELKDPAYVPLWSTKKKLSKHFQYFAKFAKQEDVKNLNLLSMIDGTSMDGTIEVRGMKLLMVPKDAVEARKAWKRKQAKTPEEMEKEAKILLGMKGEGKFQIEGQIVQVTK